MKMGWAVVLFTLFVTIAILVGIISDWGTALMALFAFLLVFIAIDTWKDLRDFRKRRHVE